MTQSQAASPVGATIADIATKNLDKKARDHNSANEIGFFTSSHGDHGEPELWCADFVRWVWKQAGVLNTDVLTPAASSFAKYGPLRAGNPQVGDAVLFNLKNGVADHVAIVVDVRPDGRIISIGGDERGQEGTDAHFASTSRVAQDGPYDGRVSTSGVNAPGAPGKNLSGYVSPVARPAALPSNSTTPVVAWGPDRLDVFGTDSNQAALHKAWNGQAWTGWVPLSSPASSAPAVVSWGPNRLDVFAVRPDSALVHKAWNGKNWSDWESVASHAGSAPAAVSWGRNRLDVFVTGPDHAVMHKSWGGDQWGGASLSGKVSPAFTTPAAVARAFNRLDVFVVGTNNAIFRKAWNGSAWSDWEPLGMNAASNPQVVSWGPNRLDVFVTGPDHAVTHMAWNGGKWGGNSLGGKINPTFTTPTAIARAFNRLDVFVVGTNNAIFRKEWNGSAWSDWESLGGVAASRPHVASRGPNQLDVFVLGTDGAVHHSAWHGGNWTAFEKFDGVIQAL
jgi:hypothetical protein